MARSVMTFAHIVFLADIDSVACSHKFRTGVSKNRCGSSINCHLQSPAPPAHDVPISKCGSPLSHKPRRLLHGVTVAWHDQLYPAPWVYRYLSPTFQDTSKLNVCNKHARLYKNTRITYTFLATTGEWTGDSWHTYLSSAAMGTPAMIAITLTLLFSSLVYCMCTVPVRSLYSSIAIGT
jgi:hypothetical protein